MAHNYEQWFPISLLLGPSGLVFRPNVRKRGNSSGDVRIPQHFEVNLNELVSDAVRICRAGTYNDFAWTQWHIAPAIAMITDENTPLSQRRNYGHMEKRKKAHQRRIHQSITQRLDRVSGGRVDDTFQMKPVRVE
jgi:hypothetical protein